MPFLAFFGVFLLGTGPLIALFLLFIARKSFVVLLSFASTFYWLSVLLLLATLFRGWTPIPTSPGARAIVLLTSVTVEQLANLGLYRIYRKLRILLMDTGRRRGHGFNALDALWVSFGVGFGHAAAHSIFFFVGLLETTSRDATHYDFDTCPQLSLYTALALMTLGLGLFHLFSTVVFFEGCSNKNAVQSLLPPAMHLLVSMMTLTNFTRDGCLVVIPMILAVAIGNVVWVGSITWNAIKVQYPTYVRSIDGN